MQHWANLFKVLDAQISLTPEQWGFMMFKNPIEHTPPVLPHDERRRVAASWLYDDELLTLTNGAVLKIKETIFRQRGLIGRGTHVFAATITQAPDNGDPLWTVDTTVAVKLSWIPKTRMSEDEIIKRALDSAVGEHEWVKNHLPCPMYTADWEEEDEERVKFFDEITVNNYEERVLRITVFEKLEPLATADNPYDFANVARQIFACTYITSDGEPL